MQLPKLRIATQKLEGEVAFAEKALRTSYAGEPGLARFWSWRVPMMKERLRPLHEEHEVQAEAIKNLDEQLV